MKRPRTQPLPPRSTYRVSAALWAQLAPLIASGDPLPPATIKPRTDPRIVLNAVLYRTITGCTWWEVEEVGFGDDSTLQRTFKRWTQSGLLSRLFAVITAQEQEAVA